MVGGAGSMSPVSLVQVTATYALLSSMSEVHASYLIARHRTLIAAALAT